ncbi:WD40 repeat-like protein [Epithele typhae]|uniref:WD40 repeat-like protein n=1 Tax=Epithele typhae TaxID=378194 RepID=UPI0020080244|nr:WD40 repeat-like protein [Epithele typhae]KAH9931618.1 WD40 repeat-like protein [Epithele typhae]
MRRQSVGPDGTLIFPSHSARHTLRAVNSIDYSGSAPKTTLGQLNPGTPPVAWSHSNALVFGRGNRVFYKSMNDTEGVSSQLTKLPDHLGGLRLVQAAGADQPQIVVLATHSGSLQLWDLATKRAAMQWRLAASKTPSALAWNASLLSVGDARGGVRHYDTRVGVGAGGGAAKMKDGAIRVTRHQGRITAMAWGRDGVHVACGDQNGLVLVWDIRKPRVPLELGEMVQRRRKMQHSGAITALTWCPWYGNYLLSGDTGPEGTGVLRSWDFSNGDEIPTATQEKPNRVEFDAPVTSIHFSPHINEMVTTHGAAAAPADAPPSQQPLPGFATNSIVVHQFPALRCVRSVRVADHALAGSVLSPNGHRIAVAVPEECQLKVWEVWGKLRDSTKQAFMSCTIR